MLGGKYVKSIQLLNSERRTEEYKLNRYNLIDNLLFGYS